MNAPIASRSRRPGKGASDVKAIISTFDRAGAPSYPPKEKAPALPPGLSRFRSSGLVVLVRVHFALDAAELRQIQPLRSGQRGVAQRLGAGELDVVVAVLRGLLQNLEDLARGGHAGL